MAFLARLGVTAAALWLATALYPQALQVRSPRTLLLAGLALGVVNAVVRPVILLLTLPLNLLTLGLFTLVVNALMLSLVAALTALEVTSFWWAVAGALLISLISTALSALLAR